MIEAFLFSRWFSLVVLFLISFLSSIKTSSYLAMLLHFEQIQPSFDISAPQQTETCLNLVRISSGLRIGLIGLLPTPTV